jgi:NADH-quinone oxidoreductase subunit J
MSAGVLIFALSTVVCLAGALVTVAAKNPIRGAVGLLATILGIAGLFLKLEAQFLAAIQLIVYAGAVVVLFVFVIMLLGPDAGSDTDRRGRGKIARTFGALLVGGSAIWALFLFMAQAGSATRFGAPAAGHGTVEAVGTLIFTKGLVPFELATVLLIVAAVGAIGVARSRPTKRDTKKIESPTRRMFHGPILERASADSDKEGS